METLQKLFMAFTRRERNWFFAAAVVVSVSGGILAALLIGRNSRVVPVRGGEYTEGFLEQPAYINPVIATTPIDKSIVKLVFSNVPTLADKIDVSSDGRTWDIRMKEQLLWQDGQKLTSDDVVFTIQKIQDPEAMSPLAKLWQGASVHRVSELELQITLVNPDPNFRATIEGLYVLPQHLFGDVPPSNWRLSDYNLKPVGAGPYRFLSYDRQSDGFIDSYALVAWDGYAGNPPLISNFDFAFFNNLGALLNDFNAGRIDGIAGLEPDGLTGITRPHTTWAFYLPSYYAVFLNQSRSVPLKDLAVRQALSATIDRQALVQNILHGYGAPALGPIPLGTPYADPALSSTTDSIDTVSSSLDAAGWKLGDDGVRVKTIGTTPVRLELTLTVPQIGFLTKTADALVAQWTALGFHVTVNQLSLDDIANNAIKNRDYDMLLFGNVLNSNFDLSPFWHSSQRYAPGLNLALYNNKQADSLMDNMPAPGNEDARKKQFFNLQEAIANDAPAVFLYSLEYAYVTTKDLRGVNPGVIADPSSRFLNVTDWYVKTARVLN